MKKTIYQVSVPKPCHENWDQMTPTEKGRFCQACQKKVIDFSRMSDLEIVNILKENQNLCGSWDNRQLNRPISTDYLETPPLAWWRGPAMALLAMLATRLPAIAGAKAPMTMQKPYSNKLANNEIVNGPDNGPGKIVVKATVTSAITGDTITYLPVSLYRNDTCIARTVTDENGHFTFETKKDCGLFIEISYKHPSDSTIKPIYYKSKPIENSDEHMLIKLNADASTFEHIMIRGEVVVYVQQPTFKNKVKRAIRKITR